MQAALLSADRISYYEGNACRFLWRYGKPLFRRCPYRIGKTLGNNVTCQRIPKSFSLRCSCSADERFLSAASSSSDEHAESSAVIKDAFHPEASYLKRLYIEDFILVKKEEVFFDPGFNVVTGESGAGKSLLIEALSQVLGKTSLGNCIRPSCDTAALEATFHLAANGMRRVRALFRQFDVHLHGLTHLQDVVGGDISLRREISQTSSGLRSRCFVNGDPVSVRVLKAISEVFFDINGQYAVTQLGNKQQQMELIDRITGKSTLQQEIASTFERMSELKSLLSVSSEFEDEEIREGAERLCEEVTIAGVGPGEERSLRYALQVLETHATSVENAVGIGRSLDGGSDGIIHALQNVSSRIKSIARQEQRNADLSDTEEDEDIDECDSNSINCALHCLDDALEHIERAEKELEDAAEDVLDFASFVKFDQVEQSELRQRLKEIEKLLKDFQCRSTEELLDLTSETQARLDQYIDSCDRRTEWESELATVEEAYIQKSVSLSLARREMAGKLRKAIEDCLYDLAMQKSRFDIRINWEYTQKQVQGVYVTSEIATEAGERGDDRYLATADGFDSVEFLLAPGPTEPLRALSGVASGGECARIMLAFKAAPTLIQDDKEIVPVAKEAQNDASGVVLVLDELDTGVGVRLGKTVGKLLRRICTNAEEMKNQVICISHLPQVAAYASTHIKATKSINDEGKMEIQFRSLKTETERSEEINAMMGSSENLAYELLDDANRRDQ